MDTTRRGAGISNLTAAGRAPYRPVLRLRHGPPTDHRNRPYRRHCARLSPLGRPRSAFSV